MSENVRGIGERKLGGLRTNAETIRMDDYREARIKRGFTDGWKELCRDILERYCIDPNVAIDGKPIKPPTLRDRILTACGKELNDTRLSRDHLYSWFKGRSGIGDAAFSFIDQFVRSIQISDPAYEDIKEKIIKEADARQRIALRGLFSVRSDGSTEHHKSRLAEMEGCLLFSPIIDWHAMLMDYEADGRIIFRQIALEMGTFEHGVCGVKAIYSRIPFSEIADCTKLTRKHFIAFHGYAVPLVWPDRFSAGGILHLFQRSVQGIHTLQSYSSSAFYHDGDYGLRTEWCGQIAAPMQELNMNPEVEVSIPMLDKKDLSLNDNFELYKSKMTNRGFFTFEYQEEDKSNLKQVMKNLQDGYLLW